MKRYTRGALVFAVLLTGCLYLLHRLGVGLPLLGALALVAGLIANFAPRLGLRLLDAAEGKARELLWRHEAGRHHAFEGLSLHVEDDGRFVWIDGSDLQRALRTADASDVLAARHAGRWRRDARGRVLLRVDSVVERLAAAPGRMEPRTVRLRRYLERELLFPAARRRERSSPSR